MQSRLQNLLIVVASSLLLAITGQLIQWMPNALDARGLIGLVFGGWRPATTVEIVVSTVVYAFVWDFFQYWWHRAEHTIGLLWSVHALHHDEEKVNSTTSLRNTFWSGLLSFFAVHIPTIMICGLNLLTVYGASLLFIVWGFFNHANVRLNLGPVTSIISGPQWHRLHHGRDPAYYNKNFAAFFPVIDLMFGTYRHPVQDEFPSTGLVDRPQGQLGLMSLARDIFGVVNPTAKPESASSSALALSLDPISER